MSRINTILGVALRNADAHCQLIRLKQTQLVCLARQHNLWTRLEFELQTKGLEK